jgi:hypothetical protein
MGGLRFQISLRPARRLSLCEPVTSDNCHESLNLFMIWRFRHPGSRRFYDNRRELNPEHVNKIGAT